MLQLIPYYLITFVLLFVYGVLPFIILKQSLPQNPVLFFISGLAVLGFISLFWWIAGPINNFSYYTVFAGGFSIVVLNYKYFKAACKNLFDKILDRSAFELICLVLLLIPVLFQSSQATKINDMGMYYMQTIQWMHSFGIIKGLANLHPAMGLGSAWHSLVTLLDPPIDNLSPKWHLNGILFYLFFLYYLLEQDKTIRPFQFAIFFLSLPLAFLYLTAPSADLPVLLLSGIMFNLVFFEKKKVHPIILLLICVFIFACKPPAFIPVIIAILVLFKLVTLRSKLLYCMAAFILISPVLYKNFILSGYVLYPYNKPNITNVEWKVPADWNDAYTKGIISWGLNDKTDKKTLVQTKHTALDQLGLWLNRKGYKGIMNKLIFVNFLMGLFTIINMLYQKKKEPFIPVYVIAVLIIVTILEWKMLSQYRLLLPTALILAGINFMSVALWLEPKVKLLIPLNNYSRLQVLICTMLFFVMAFVPFNILQEGSRNKDITQSKGFSTDYLLRPYSGFINEKTDSTLKDSIYIYYFPNKTYCWNCKIPCVSFSHAAYLKINFGYVLKPMGSKIADGFKLVEGVTN